MPEVIFLNRKPYNFVSYAVYNQYKTDQLVNLKKTNDLSLDKTAAVGIVIHFRFVRLHERDNANNAITI